MFVLISYHSVISLYVLMINQIINNYFNISLNDFENQFSGNALVAIRSSFGYSVSAILRLRVCIFVHIRV